MIRGVVLHFASEQPLQCDLRALPAASDVCLTVTNLRFLDGRKPGFIDHQESWFLYPIGRVSFIEIPPGAMEASDMPALPSGALPGLDLDDVVHAAADDADEEDPEAERAADELLRRMRSV
ncbi:MAG: hypothetical protein U0869_20900 [Chloroflexota bacterium]